MLLSLLGQKTFLILLLGVFNKHMHIKSILIKHTNGRQSTGYKPLAWTMRVQIALDAAKGLEYIHKQTNPSYVHRDVKTSNILLDSNFCAKVSFYCISCSFSHVESSQILKSLLRFLC